MTDLIYTVALSKSFVQSAFRVRKIIDYYGNAEAAYNAGFKELNSFCNGHGKEISRFLSKESLLDAEKEIDWAGKFNLRICTLQDSDYPAKMKECPDAPILFFMMGQPVHNRPRSVAVVGTRRSTPYGKKYCEELIERLSLCRPKPVIISGLAEGIDSYAHNAALKYDMETIAVMGTGFDTIFPSCNRKLADKIVEKGAIITEYFPATAYYPTNFVRRNRIIAAMSDCILVAESRIKGGGLITARLGFDYNRDVFAVPGKMDDITFQGCNRLIEEQIAKIVTSGETISRIMGWDTAQEQLKINFTEEPVKQSIIEYLRYNGAADASTIAIECSFSIDDVTIPLLELEMAGNIIHLPNNKYII
ncbi:MAG: DNA-protecting protein DprA [Bacteroidales bacterium]|nr:DNA-protecting protein DprA [Bacteroidales bacterium]